MAHSLKDFAIRRLEVAEPSLRESDVLIQVRSIGINPGEAYFRRTRSATPGERVLLGLEFAGVVVGLGSAVGWVVALIIFALSLLQIRFSGVTED